MSIAFGKNRVAGTVALLPDADRGGIYNRVIRSLETELL
jgi:hypothetical protein